MVIEKKKGGIQGYTGVYRGIQGYTRVYKGIQGFIGYSQDIIRSFT